MKAILTFGLAGLASVDLDSTADEVAAVLKGLAEKPVVNISALQAVRVQVSQEDRAKDGNRAGCRSPAQVQATTQPPVGA